MRLTRLVARALGSDWTRATPDRALRSWLRELHECAPARKTAAVHVGRNRTWLEWGVYAACQLRLRGRQPLFVFSGSDLETLSNRSHTVDRIATRRFWSDASKIPDARFADLDLIDAVVDSEDRAVAEDYAPSVAAYDLKVEEHEGGDLRAEYLRHTGDVAGRLARMSARARVLFQREACERLVVYSGLIADTSALCGAASRCRLPYSAVEGWAWRPGHMVCNHDSPALDYKIAEWARSLGEWSREKEQEYRDLAAYQEAGVDDARRLHSVQRTPANATLPARLISFLEPPGPVFLMAPNVVGDSSTMRRKSPFRSQREWIHETIAYFRAHSELRVVFRAHPDEAWLGTKVRERLGDIAAAAAGDAHNVYVIHGLDHVNSYGLMPRAWAGLVWISSIGPDMVVRGVPVVTGAQPKYTGFSFAIEPDTKSSYFATIARLARQQAPTTAGERARAKLYLDIIFNRFSYNAFSPTYRAENISLRGGGAPADAELFYDIVAGDMPAQTPTRQVSAGSCRSRR